MKQEKEDASEEVVEVAPGIRRLQLPIDFTGLGHVNCYALEDARGVTLVDPGLPGEESWRALQARLATAEVPLARVHTVVVTHSHPDHFGSAGLLAQETGADIVAFERFRTVFDPAETDESELEARDSVAEVDAPPTMRLSRPSPWGGENLGPPPERVAAMRERAAEMFRWLKVPLRTVRVADGQRITLGGRSWRGIFTPGHTDDHLCLYDEGSGVLLAGDQVLPTITPHISGVLPDDSLGRYVDSLDGLASLPDVSLVPPAHGHPFTDLSRRVKEIKVHHEERLAELPGDRRRAGVGQRHRPVPPPLRRALLGSDGRGRDLRPPRAPPPRRSGPTPGGDRAAPLSPLRSRVDRCDEVWDRVPWDGTATRRCLTWCGRSAGRCGR